MLLPSVAVSFESDIMIMNENSAPNDWASSFRSRFLMPVLSKNVELAVSILDSIMKGIIEIEILSHSMQKVRELMLCYTQTIHLLCLIFFFFTVCKGKQMCRGEGNTASTLNAAHIAQSAI